MNDTKLGVEAVRQDKHMDLHNAIQDINSVVTALENLLDRIQGPMPQTAEKEPSAPMNSGPSLSEILSGGPDEVRGKIEKSHHFISRIKEELF